MNLTDLTDSCSEDTSVIHQGRWRRVKSQQPPSTRYAVTDLQPTWADIRPILSLGPRITTSPAFRQQFHYLFLDAYLPTEMRNPSGPKPAVSRNFILQLQDSVIQSPALETSITAFLTARVGRKYHDDDLVHRTRSMYVAGLEQLQQALRYPQSRLSDETLAACMVLSLYELTECPADAPEAYISHQRGSMMLLHLRGPDASASPLGHSIFLALRSQTVSFASSPG